MTIRQPHRSPDPRPDASGTAEQSTHQVSRGGPSAETRRKVILAVGSLIDRLDYHSVTIEAVARAAGVSKSTIYRHWPSREVLVLEAYTHKTNEPIPDTGDALDDLRTYVSKLAFCVSFGAASTVAGLIVDAVEDPEFAVLFKRILLHERRRAFVTILSRGQMRGQVRADVDLETAVDAIYGAVHHRLLVSGQAIDGPFVTALVDVVTRGLIAPERRAGPVGLTSSPSG